MTTALTHWTRRSENRRPQNRPANRPEPNGEAVAVVPALGPLPPLIVRTTPRRLDSRVQD